MPLKTKKNHKILNIFCNQAFHAVGLFPVNAFDLVYHLIESFNYW